MGCDFDFTVVDVETTGLDPIDDAPVEVAAIRFCKGHPYERLETLVRPDRRIPAIASAVHGITDDDVRNAPPYPIVLKHLLAFIGDSYVVAHNASFDRTLLNNIFEDRWICTMRLSRRLWPNAPSHSLQALRYWLALPVAPRDFGRYAAHTAAGDAWLAGQLFLREIETLLLYDDGLSLEGVANIASTESDDSDAPALRGGDTKLDTGTVLVLQHEIMRRSLQHEDR